MNKIDDREEDFGIEVDDWDTEKISLFSKGLGRLLDDTEISLKIPLTKSF